MIVEKEKSILITGCSSGIGRCVAEGLKRRGYRVFATARNQIDVERLAAEGFDSHQLDLADAASIDAALDHVLSATNGQLYGLFNNGAYGQPGAVEDLTREVLRTQLETNLLGWHQLTRGVLPSMRSQGTGRVINNSSILGFISMPYRGAYNCSKHALEGLSDTLRMELKGSGIYVSLIEPGPIVSRFRENALRMWRQNIDIGNSVHRDAYLALAQRLEKKGSAAPFTLPPEAVLQRVIHALESPRPKPRYYVTLPTYLFAGLKRLLSTRVLDAIILRVSGGGQR